MVFFYLLISIDNVVLLGDCFVIFCIFCFFFRVEMEISDENKVGRINVNKMCDVCNM